MSKEGGFCCAWHIKAYLPQSYKLAVSLEREALEMCAASRLQWVWWSNCSPQWTAQHITESPGRALITPSHGACAPADTKSDHRIGTLRSDALLRPNAWKFFSCPFFQLCFSLLPHLHADFEQFICVLLFFCLVFLLSPVRHSDIIYMTTSRVCLSVLHYTRYRSHGRYPLHA